MERYIIEVVVFQLLFLALYHFVFKKETFFVHNRWYLLLTPLVALVLPFIQIPILQNTIDSLSLIHI